MYIIDADGVCARVAFRVRRGYFDNEATGLSRVDRDAQLAGRPVRRDFDIWLGVRLEKTQHHIDRAVGNDQRGRVIWLEDQSVSSDFAASQNSVDWLVASDDRRIGSLLATAQKPSGWSARENTSASHGGDD